MKKLLTILLAALLCVCCVSMVACKEEAGVEGTYKFYSLTVDTTTYEVGDTIPGGGMFGPNDMTLTADAMTLELKKDGTAISKNNGETHPGVTMTWSKSGNTITLTSTYVSGGETQTDTQNLTLNGNEITMVANPDTPYEATYVFKKA